jgi:hypothetical protein
VLVLLNGGPQDLPFALPVLPLAGRFVERLDTAGPAARERDGPVLWVRAHSLVVLEWESTP